MNFVLDVAKWRCGSNSRNPTYRVGAGVTSLLNKQGSQCCVGQFLEQCGVPRENLLNNMRAEKALDSIEVPSEIVKNPFTSHQKKDPFAGVDREFTFDLYGINDDSRLDPETSCPIKRTIPEKIAAIRAILRKRGHSLRVKNLKKVLSRAK